MTAIKERIIGAVTIMSDSDAERFWEFIVKDFNPAWDEVREAMPDEVDLQMLKAIASDPDCQEFTRESEIDWDE